MIPPLQNPIFNSSSLCILVFTNRHQLTVFLHQPPIAMGLVGTKAQHDNICPQFQVPGADVVATEAGSAAYRQTGPEHHQIRAQWFHAQQAPHGRCPAVHFCTHDRNIRGKGCALRLQPVRPARPTTTACASPPAACAALITWPSKRKACNLVQYLWYRDFILRPLARSEYDRKTGSCHFDTPALTASA